MGVSGSGKSTVGERLAHSLGVPFQEGDSLHPESNIEKMRSGVPLTDEDRYPWLDRVASWINGRADAAAGGVVSCSALKREYRDRIIDARKGVRLVYLSAREETIAQRLASRPDHFMPASLLRSQFEVLEPPTPEERPIIVDVTAPLRDTLERIVLALGAG